MLRVSLRSALRLAAVVAALGCGWVAIATEQKAHAPLCASYYAGNPLGIRRGGPSPKPILCRTLRVSYPIAPVGTTWLAGPTIAMSVAILAALVLALLAISPRQGTLLAYRWRRAVY